MVLASPGRIVQVALKCWNRISTGIVDQKGIGVLLLAVEGIVKLDHGSHGEIPAGADAPVFLQTDHHGILEGTQMDGAHQRKGLFSLS